MYCLEEAYRCLQLYTVFFVLHVCMLRNCEGDGNAGVVDVGGMVEVSTMCECMGGTRGSCVVLEMSVVRVERCGSVYVFGSGRGERCGGERIGFGLYQSCRNRGSMGHVSVFGLRWCGS